MHQQFLALDDTTLKPGFEEIWGELFAGLAPPFLKRKMQTDSHGSCQWPVKSSHRQVIVKSSSSHRQVIVKSSSSLYCSQGRTGSAYPVPVVKTTKEGRWQEGHPTIKPQQTVMEMRASKYLTVYTGDPTLWEKLDEVVLVSAVSHCNN